MFFFRFPKKKIFTLPKTNFFFIFILKKNFSSLRNRRKEENNKICMVFYVAKNQNILGERIFECSNVLCFAVRKRQYRSVRTEVQLTSPVSLDRLKKVSISQDRFHLVPVNWPLVIFSVISLTKIRPFYCWSHFSDTDTIPAISTLMCDSKSVVTNKLNNLLRNVS